MLAWWVLLVACSSSGAGPLPPAPVAAPVAPPPPPKRGVDTLETGTFTALERGLEVGVFTSDQPHPVGDGRIHVVRIDPEHFELVLRMASADPAHGFQTADAWASELDLVAAINPSMYHADGKSVFFMRGGGHTNQAQRHTNAGNVLVSDPVGAQRAVDMLDITCGESFDEALSQYRTVVQSYRLLGCHGTPTWKVNAKVWSHAVVGVDGQGRLLFVHARTPWNTRVFTDILRELPLDIKRLMYGEGGPEASLVVRSGDYQIEEMGSYETGFVENDDNHHFWPIPNILGVVRKAKP